jgi:hypothetical protein
MAHFFLKKTRQVIISGPCIHSGKRRGAFKGLPAALNPVSSPAGGLLRLRGFRQLRPPRILQVVVVELHLFLDLPIKIKIKKNIFESIFGYNTKC